MSRAEHVTDKGEIFLPFPNGAGRGGVPEAKQFRTTWLAGSLRALKDRGHMPRYLKLLPEEHHASILGAVAGTWLPIELALTHYSACDRLALPTQELIEIGHDVTRQVHGTVLGFLVRIAKGAGVSPWTPLGKLNDLRGRIFMGGGVCVVKLGPKEARVEIAGWPCARATYCRVAMRGILRGILELFCERAYANEIPSMCTASTLGHRISWV